MLPTISVRKIDVYYPLYVETNDLFVGRLCLCKIEWWLWAKCDINRVEHKHYTQNNEILANYFAMHRLFFILSSSDGSFEIMTGKKGNILKGNINHCVLLVLLHYTDLWKHAWSTLRTFQAAPPFISIITYTPFPSLIKRDSSLIRSTITNELKFILIFRTIGVA